MLQHTYRGRLRTLTSATTASATLYAAAYLVASSLDLWTTRIALRGGGPDGNPFVNSGGDYDAARAWFITALGGVVLVAYFVFGAVNANRVAAKWLRRPMRSFFVGPWSMASLVPWSKAVLDRSPLHALSFAVAFVILRLLGAGNNLCLVLYRVAPIGWFVNAVSTRTSPVLGLFVVGGGLYVLLALATSPWVAWIIASQRMPSG